MKKFLAVIFSLILFSNVAMATNSYNKYGSENQNRNSRDKKQEQANLYEFGYDEYESSRNKNNKDLEREKWYNYEYYTEDNGNE